MKKFAIACALIVPALSLADDVGHSYVQPSVGGVSVDNRRPTEDKNWLYGFKVGKHVSEAWTVEGSYDRAVLDGRFGYDKDRLQSLGVDVLRVFNRGDIVAPYLSAGLGVLRSELKPGNEKDDDFMVEAGAGLLIRLWSNDQGTRSLSLRPDLKVRWSDAGGQTLRDYVATLGFQYAFGQAPVRTAAPAPAPAPQPEPAAPVPPPQPQPPGDSDRDGVTDDKDKCPGTPSGVAVDEFGCPRQGSITLEGVTFELNSATLTADARTVLDGVAADLRKYPRLRIELQGHTDSLGADAYNLQLSQRRAESVRDYLVSAGVSASQLEARGYGETTPIDTNATAEGRARNRRVVMAVLDNPGDVRVEGTAETP